MWCNNFQLDQHYTLYLWLLWTPGSSWKGPMKWSLSVFPFCHLSRCFLGIGPLDFFAFRHGTRNPYEVVCDRARFFGKTFFAPKIGEICQKYGFLNLKKSLVINFLLNLFYNEGLFYWLIFCTNPIFCEESCSWDRGQNTLSQSDCKIFKSSISPKQVNETASFFACWYKYKS